MGNRGGTSFYRRDESVDVPMVGSFILFYPADVVELVGGQGFEPLHDLRRIRPLPVVGGGSRDVAHQRQPLEAVGICGDEVGEFPVLPSHSASRMANREVHVFCYAVCRGWLQLVRHRRKSFEHVTHDIAFNFAIHVRPNAQRAHVRQHLWLEVCVVKHSRYRPFFKCRNISLVIDVDSEEVGDCGVVYLAQLPHGAVYSALLRPISGISRNKVVCNGKNQAIKELVGCPATSLKKARNSVSASRLLWGT